MKQAAVRAAAAWQEHSSDAAFLLQDDIDDMLDSEDMDVRAEAQALVDVTVNGADTDLTVLALLLQMPMLSLQQIHLTLRHAATALPPAPADVALLDVTQRAVHDRIVQWARVVQGHLACDGGVCGDALGRWQNCALRPHRRGSLQRGRGRGDGQLCVHA